MGKILLLLLSLLHRSVSFLPTAPSPPRPPPQQPLTPSCCPSGFLGSRGNFSFLESLINFRSACTESWQRCVSHLNKRLRCYFLYLKNKLFLKKSKLTGSQQGRFLWPLFKKWAFERSIVTIGGSIRGPPGKFFPLNVSVSFTLLRLAFYLGYLVFWKTFREYAIIIQ